MSNKPIFYTDVIKLIKYIALKGDSKLEHQSLSDNVCPWSKLIYRDLVIEINQYYNIILIDTISVKVPPLARKNNTHAWPLSPLLEYLYKIFQKKADQRKMYDEGNSLEIYNKHLGLMKKNQ